MKVSLLQIIHKTLLSRSIKFNYIGFPSTLNSLRIENPNKNQVMQDYALMSKHFSHPVFLNFVPNYYDLTENKYKAWLNCYAKSANT